MHKKSSILIFILALFANANAQEFAPIGAEWHYDYKCFADEGYVRINSVSDTVIDNIHCNKLEKTRFVYNHIIEDYSTQELGNEYVFQQGDSVMVYRNGRSFKLFDFGAEIGASWKIYGTSFEEYGIVEVVGKGTEELDGISLNYIDIMDQEESLWGFSWHGYNPVRIYEKIGPANSYLFPERLDMLDIGEGGLPRCYQDNELGIIHIDNEHPCDYLYDSIEEKATSICVSVFPNPSQGSFIMNLPCHDNWQIMVYDIFGRLAFSKASDEQQINIELNNCTSGLYYIIVANNQSSYYTTTISIIEK
ncbi:MAG: T9SS type A sorting domain-containing protein [Bacteroidales bacterium]|nr:T9SS type A sorting domain-containing protein [Bacteroidales bacterium]